jgi:hypothetical protein
VRRSDEATKDMQGIFEEIGRRPVGAASSVEHRCMA